MFLELIKRTIRSLKDQIGFCIGLAFVIAVLGWVVVAFVFPGVLNGAGVGAFFGRAILGWFLLGYLASAAAVAWHRKRLRQRPSDLDLAALARPFVYDLSRRCCGFC